ncbi:MAG: hypothetical protein ACRDZ7_22795 [Acidimicrobiia bacterium]
MLLESAVRPDRPVVTAHPAGSAGIGVVLPHSSRWETGATLAGTGRFVDDVGYRSVWLRDWPIGVRNSVYPLDTGTGHDPVAYASILRTLLPPEVTVGLAVLRLDYREPAVTARSIVSMASLARGPMIVGLGGASSNDPTAQEETVRTYRRVRALLSSADHDFVVPDDFVCPPLYLASRSVATWEGIGFEAEGVLTTEVHPRRLEESLAPLRRHRPGLSVGLEFLVELDRADPERMVRQGRTLIVGRRRIGQLARAWSDAGVQHLLVHMAPASSRDEHLDLVDAISGRQS